MKINYRDLVEYIDNHEDLSELNNAQVIDDNEQTLFKIVNNHKLVNTAKIEVIDASGIGIADDDLELIKEKIAEVLNDEDILDKLSSPIINKGLPKS